MKKIISIFFISIILFSGCNFLDEDDKASITNDDLYSTVAGYETLMTAAYSTLREIWGPTPWITLVGTDMYNIGRSTDNAGLYTYDIFSTNTQIRNFYRACYEGIQILNMGLLYNPLPPLDEPVREMYAAELRFLRALYHFWLIEQFGGIVINDQATRSATTSMPRMPLADSYDFVITEMEDVLDQLGNTKGRITQDAARHFLAKAYLTRGWDTNSSSDFNAAKNYANQVITKMGAINLTYERVWDPMEHDNDEVIFAVQYSVASLASRTNGSCQSSLYTPHLGGTETNQKQGADDLLTSWSMLMRYTENDNRYMATFMELLYENYWDYYRVEDKTDLKVRAWYPRIWGATTRAEYDDLEAEFRDNHEMADNNLRYFPFVEDEELYRSTYNNDFNQICVKKFDDPNSWQYRGGRASSRNIVLARLAETYYLYAEACIALLDYPTAVNYVQQVLNRPGNLIDPSGAILPNALAEAVAADGSPEQILEGYLIESSKEFFGEFNGRWAELRRTHMLSFMVHKYSLDVRRLIAGGQAPLNFTNKYNLRPIPNEAIELNDALDPVKDQNPGY